MHIALNARSFSLPKISGIGRYTYNLARELPNLDLDVSYSLYFKTKLFGDKRRLPHIQAQNLNVVKDVFGLGPERCIPKCDIYHAPAPEVCPVKHKKLIVTIHDLVYLAFPDGHTEQARRQTDEQIRSFINKAVKFICCSESTKNDLMKFFNVSPDKISVVYQGVDHNVFYPMSEHIMPDAVYHLNTMGIKSDYILCVGTIEPRKNLERVVEVFAELKRKKSFTGQLVIAGMKGWKMGHIQKKIIDLGLHSEVLFLGYIEDFELRYLYNYCELFFFPSLYEGFGYPIVEAMCCGAAVVTSNVSSCPEVAGDAALCVDPKNHDEMVEALEKVLNNESRRKDLSLRGLKRAQNFHFRKTAQQTLDVYKQVLGAL